MSDLRAELLAIREDYGRLTPEVVVEAATPANHPLHHRFEWDNEIAGPAYRRQQAADLIREVRIRRLNPDTDQPAVDVRAFLAVKTSLGNVYEPAEVVVADPILRSIVLREMDRDWRALKQRYTDFEEFWALLATELAAAS